MKPASWKRKAVVMAAAVAVLALRGAPPSEARESRDDQRVIVRDVVTDVRTEVIRDVMRDVRRDIRPDVSRSLRDVRELRRLVHEDLRAVRDLQLDDADPAALRAALDRLDRRLRELEMRLEAEGWR